MSDAPAVADEARAVLSAARGWLAEWVEEGVTSFPSARTQPPSARAQPSTDGADLVRETPAPESASAYARASSPAHESESAPPPPSSNAEVLAPPTLEDVRAELGECTRCGLCEGRTNIVFGDGNPSAALMFIGEGPGADEDARGLPFVGRAGELLTKMIEAGLGIARDEVYICNIVKCRPPGNRDPLPEEVARCRPFLDGQIAALRPRVIVTLGKPATSALLGRTVAITRERGTWHEYRGIPVMPTFHPAFVLRRYTKETRALVWQDLKAAHARSLS